MYALESTNYPVIVILSSFSRGTNLFASEITKIASRYGFASGVSDFPFQSEGKIPINKDLLKIDFKKGAITAAESFSNFTGILSRPEDLLVLIFVN